MVEQAPVLKSLLDAGDPRDVLVVHDLLLLHSGVYSSSTAWLAVMHSNPGAFKGERIAIVYNPFDRVVRRPTLSDVLRYLPCSDSPSKSMLALDRSARETPRLIDEYTRQGDSWRLTHHDVELYSYLVRTHGQRCLVVSDLGSITEITPRQITNHVLMVVPIAFAYNCAAAVDNKFMLKPADEESLIRRSVRQEFYSLYTALIAAGVNVSLISDPGFDTPDAVFPNNWFSTHCVGECADGCSTLITYPMKPETRRNERRPEIIDKIRSIRSYERFVDFSSHELKQDAEFLEGTGSMVLDRVHRVCYASISERTHLRLAEDWTKQLGYRLVAFYATDAKNASVYHTNVLMALGTRFAIICADAIADPPQRRMVLENISEFRDVITISMQQMGSFCGNILELVFIDVGSKWVPETERGRSIVAMSTQAYDAFDEGQRSNMLKHVSEIVHVAIPTIESVGGGGARCMIAEIF